MYQIIVSNFYIETISRCVICHKQYSKRYKSYTRTSIHAFLSCLLSCFFFLLFFSNVEIKWNEMESIRIAWFDCNSKAKKSNHSLSYYFNLFSSILSNRQCAKSLSDSYDFIQSRKNCQEITLLSRYYVLIRIFRWPVPNERNNIQFSKVSDKYSAFRWVVATSRHGKLVLDFVVNDFMCSINTKWNGFRLNTIYFYLYTPYGSWEPRTLICTMTIKDKL